MFPGLAEPPEPLELGAALVIPAALTRGVCALPRNPVPEDGDFRAQPAQRPVPVPGEVSWLVLSFPGLLGKSVLFQHSELILVGTDSLGLSHVRDAAG